MTEIKIGFEGQKRDVDDLGFGLFDGMLHEGLKKETPGDTTIVLKPLPLRKGVGHALIEIGLVIGDKVALPLFLAWLYDKWKKAGEKPISIKIENHFYQFDPELLTKAIEDALSKQKQNEK